MLITVNATKARRKNSANVEIQIVLDKRIIRLKKKDPLGREAGKAVLIKLCFDFAWQNALGKLSQWSPSVRIRDSRAHVVSI